MPKHLPLLPILPILLLLLLPLAHPLTTPTSLDTTSTKTITNFNTDLAACSCNISTACDTFCCCDSTCTADTVAKWTAAGWCTGVGAEVEKFCEKIGTKGIQTFQDLGCIMYSNRGAIGQFYSTPDSNNFADPNILKFSTYNTNAQGIAPYTLPSSTTYQSNTPLLLKTPTSSPKPLLAWFPSLGHSCRQSYIPIQQQSTTQTCLYQIHNSETCTNVNADLVGSGYLFCQFYGCGTTVVPGVGSTTGVAAASFDAATGLCTGVVTGVDVTVVIDYTNGQYRVVSGTLGVTTAAARVKGKVAITTRISMKKLGMESSGNPGYLIGKTLRYSFGGIYEIASATDSSCILASAPSSTPLNIKFGINQTFHCLSSAPCSNPLYIDQLSLASTFKLLKYASQSTEEITVSGRGSTDCNIEQFTLNILYSYSGWVLDPQFYILGATVTSQATANGAVKMKKFNVKWVRVEPDAVYTPPINYFSKYFSYLWEPLKGAFYKYTGNT